MELKVLLKLLNVQNMYYKTLILNGIESIVFVEWFNPWKFLLILNGIESGV